MRAIRSRLRAHPSTNRGDMGSFARGGQRDQTTFLSALEQGALEMSARIFFCHSFTLATLDDDVYGTRAVENQVKTLSARKADREGHTAEVMADALFRITFGYSVSS